MSTILSGNSFTSNMPLCDQGYVSGGSLAESSRLCYHYQSMDTRDTSVKLSMVCGHIIESIKENQLAFTENSHDIYENIYENIYRK